MLKCRKDKHTRRHASLLSVWQRLAHCHTPQQLLHKKHSDVSMSGFKRNKKLRLARVDYHHEHLTLPNIRITKALSRCYLRATCWSNHVTQCVVAVQADGLVSTSQAMSHAQARKAVRTYRDAAMHIAGDFGCETYPWQSLGTSIYATASEHHGRRPPNM